MDITESPQLIILGSMAFDDIETPFGKHTGLLGGSATYAALSAGLFSIPGILSVVGDDFPKQYWKLLMRKHIDVSGIQVGGKTFHWQGFYEYDMSAAKTLCTELNCLESYNPVLPEQYKKARFVFLGNTHPNQQMQVINQLEAPDVIAIDTMNLWIEHTRDALMEVIKKINILILNDGEARALFNTANLVQAGRKALHLGPQYVIIKKGEHGAIMFTQPLRAEAGFSNGAHFNAPAYPLETIKDPTGCGDSFGGGMMGYIAGEGSLSDEILRKAIIYGSVCASYCAEDFGTLRLEGLKKKDIEQRYKEMRDIRHF